ncbi:MAG: efflux RND transporter permease subunit [Nitrospiraceae bacterium]
MESSNFRSPTTISILSVALLIVVSGVYAMRQLPIDAVPDVTPNQVQILTNGRAFLSPVEVEQFITFPVETALSGLPGITLIRSVRFGLSAVTIYFDEGMDIYFLPAPRDGTGHHGLVRRSGSVSATPS